MIIDHWLRPDLIDSLERQTISSIYLRSDFSGELAGAAGLADVVETGAKQTKSNHDPLCTENDIGNKTIPEKQLELTNANDETIVIDDDDDNDDHPTIQKIRETLSDSNNVNKQLSTASSETDPLAFASAETETIIGDIDENDQVGREIMSAFGNNDPDPLNTCNGVEEDKQTAENSETNSLHTEMLIPIDEVSHGELKYRKKN